MSFLYYQPRKNGDLDGIINHFRDKLGDDFPSKFINTTSPELWVYNQGPENTLTESDDDLFTTKGDKPGWIGYHLVEGSLYLQAYTIKVINKTEHNNDFPISWKVYGSNNQVNFSLVEKRNTDEIFQSLGQSETFIIKNPQTFSNYYILLTGRNSNNFYHLRFSQIEFFGAYTTSTDINIKNILNKYYTTHCKERNSIIIYIIILLIMKK